MGNNTSSLSSPEDLHVRAIKGPIKLTFGVELEFIIQFKRSAYTPLKPPEHRGSRAYLDTETPTYTQALRVAIAEALLKRGIPVYDPREAEERESYDRWAVTTDATITAPGPHPEDDDYSLLEDHKCSLGFEVKTRILQLDPKGMAELRRGIVAITESFEASVNESCGLHVHVGSGRKRGFDLQTLKTLAGLIVGFEPQINSLHPAHRCAPDSWCAPLSHGYRFRALTPLQRIELIERTTSLSSFVGLFDRTSDIAVNFLNLERATRTIEFRQHEGTLDEERVASWVVLVTSLVSFAYEMLPSVYVGLVGEMMDVGGLGVEELLAWMGLEEAAEYYEKRLWEHKGLWVDPLGS